VVVEREVLAPVLYLEEQVLFQDHQIHHHLDKDIQVVLDITLAAFMFMVVVVEEPQLLEEMLQVLAHQ
jgi:hypothetical protein